MSDTMASPTTPSEDAHRPEGIRPPVDPFTRWAEIASGSGGAAAYQERFDDLETRGVDIHGEARLVASLLAPPARVLDAGCGTGRVATALAQFGYRCVGVDADLEMVQVARRRDPATHFLHADLSELYLRSQAFEAIVLAGNVVPLLAPGTLIRTMERVVAHATPGGIVVAGFGLDEAHLPPGCPVTALSTYDSACASAGLVLAHRWSSWNKDAWTTASGYAVSVHRRG